MNIERKDVLVFVLWVLVASLVGVIHYYNIEEKSVTLSDGTLLRCKDVTSNNCGVSLQRCSDGYVYASAYTEYRLTALPAPSG